MDWDVLDFAVFFGLLAGVGVTYTLAVRKLGKTAYRFAAGVALAQVLVAVIALIAGLGSTDASWPWDILVLTGFFAALWLLSAWLFGKAAVQQLRADAEPEG